MFTFYALKRAKQEIRNHNHQQVTRKQEEMDWEAQAKRSSPTEPHKPFANPAAPGIPSPVEPVITIGQRLFGVCTFLVKPVSAIVRAYRKSRRDAPRPRRKVTTPARTIAQRPFFVHAPAVVEEALRPITPTERKRRSPEVVGAGLPVEQDAEMRPAKRRNIGTTDSPWSTEAWVQESIKDIPDPSLFSTKPAYTRHLDKLKEEPAARRTSPQKYMRSRYSPYKPKQSSLLKGISLLRTPEPALPFLWADDEDEKDSKSSVSADEIAQEPAEPKEEQDIDIARVSAARLPTPPPSDDEKSSLEGMEDVIDEEEEREYRKFLREQPESFDEEGYKVPIHGIVSPETQSWNERHKQKLLRQAAVGQGTPSRLPKFFSPSILFPARMTKTTPQKQSSSPAERQSAERKLPEMSIAQHAKSVAMKAAPKQRKKSRSPVSSEGDVKAESSQASSPMPGSFDTDPLESASSGDEEEKPLPLAKDESPEPAQEAADQLPDTEEQLKKPAEGPATPDKQLQSLQISRPTDRRYRTPKANIFATQRTERTTRRQKQLEEREAERARNDYKLEPLGDEWDAKVRHAVRHGTSDQKYSPEDFARVVPEYANRGYQSKWLNDAVINDYITLVAKHGNKDDRPGQAVPTYSSLSSYFYEKLKDPANVPKRWTSKAKIPGKSLLECEAIFLPINESSHWTLCVIEGKARRLTVYNSMGHGSNARHAKNILNWLRHHLGKDFDEDEWTVNSAGVSPQQTNADDCGVFSCTTARQVMLGQMEKAPYESSIMPVQRKRMVAELVNGALLKAGES